MSGRTTPSQDRSRRRRASLLDATIDLLADEGPRAITHRAVARRAGLPTASTTYYFDSIQQLTEEALARHVVGRSDELAELAAAAMSEGRDALEIGRRLAVSLVDRATSPILAQFQIYLEAARNPAVRQPVVDALDSFEHMASVIFRSLGARDPDAAATTILAIVDGFALHRLARPQPRDEEIETLVAAMSAVLITQLMSDDEQTRWNEQLSTPLEEASTTTGAGVDPGE